jgi:hypothetical protein
VTTPATASVDPAWREAFEEFPQRFMIGTDTFTPERWHYIVPHADWTRAWLADLPLPLAERLAWRNADALLRRHGMRAPLLLLLLALAGPVLADDSCGAALDPRVRHVIGAPTLQLALSCRSRRRWPVGRHFGLDIVVCARAGARAAGGLRVDADMPAHRHGMNYRPTVRVPWVMADTAPTGCCCTWPGAGGCCSISPPTAGWCG